MFLSQILEFQCKTALSIDFKIIISKIHSFTCKEKGCSLFAINFILSQAIYRMVSGLIGGTSGEVKFYATALNLG